MEIHENIYTELLRIHRDDKVEWKNNTAVPKRTGRRRQNKKTTKKRFHRNRWTETETIAVHVGSVVTQNFGGTFEYTCSYI